jgi:hypothetical protein
MLKLGPFLEWLVGWIWPKPPIARFSDSREIPGFIRLHMHPSYRLMYPKVPDAMYRLTKEGVHVFLPIDLDRAHARGRLDGDLKPDGWFGRLGSLGSEVREVEPELRQVG